jgi:hypothetical protein
MLFNRRVIMKKMLTGIVLGLVVSGTTAVAQDPQTPRCQALASQFSENPDSLTMTELERLRFCVNQVLETRQKTRKEGLLKGTIIDSPPSRTTPPDTTPPTGSKGR